MAVYVLFCGAGMMAISLPYGTAALVGAAVIFVWYGRMSYRKFGGITGDLAGFFLQNCELAMAICVIGLKIVSGSV